MIRGGVPAAMAPARAGRGSNPAERGSATVHAVVLVALLTGLALGGLLVEGLLADRRRAESAADLAALAGAAAGQRGEDGCAAAARVAAANGARLRRCTQMGGALQVLVTRDVRAPLGRSWAVEGEARAGPLGHAPGGTG